MTEEFNKWWNSDGLIEDNPYERDTPAFWAWEGWQAALKVKREWQGLTDEEVMSLLPGAVRLPPGWVDTVQAIEAKLKEKNA